MTAGATDSLPRLAVRGALWAGIGQYALFAIGLVKAVWLARLVPAEYFGVVALATAWTSFLSFLRLDLKTVVLSRGDESEEAMAVQFIVENLLSLVGLALGVGLSLARPGTCSGDCWRVVYLLLGLKVFESLTSTPVYLLEKRIRQDVLTRLMILYSLLSLVVPVALAMGGAFIAALAVDAVLPILITGLGAWLVTRWRPRLSWNAALARDMLSFSGTLWTISLMGKVMWEGDDWLIGNLAGVSPLGYYSRAYNTGKLPMDMFAGFVARIALPLYAKGEAAGRAVLSALYGRLTWLLARLIFFFSAAMFVAAEEVTHILLSDRWLPMVPLLRLLALFIIGRPFFQNCAQVLQAIRQEYDFRRSTFVQALIMLLAGPPAVYYWGAPGAAAVSSLMTLVGWIGIEWSVSRHLGAAIWRTYLLPMAVMAGLVGGWALSRDAMAGLNVWASLLIKGLVCSLAFGLTTLVFERRETVEVFALVREAIRPDRSRP